MSSRKNKILKKNLITFLTIFDKPNILAEYLLEYDILDEKIIDYIINNKELSKKSKELKENGEIEKPYFLSIEEMREFYDNFFVIEKANYKFPLLGGDIKKDDILIELKRAIDNEEYELAVKIRDYCKTNNIKINLFFK